MSLTACAELVERGDPDRFLAAMAAPPEARRVLFPLYAFNLEVSRAPWVTEEAMIAEMRLQWWRDALEEIAEGRKVRGHDVTTALAGILDAKAAQGLDRLVAVRRWDIYKDAFEDEAHFKEYLDATAADLIWTAARLLGADAGQESATRRFGRVAGLARFLQAVPELEARGRVPLLDGRREAVSTLARAALAEATRPSLGKPARAALLEGWMAAPVLKQAADDPSRVADGRLGLSPFRKKLRLLRWS